MMDSAGNLTFLGTAGTRFAVIRQRRASGGMWLTLPEGDVSIDPGPGALVHACQLGFFEEPRQLRAILLTHRHIDHSSDLNIMTEAMTFGGRLRSGLVALPDDAIDSPEPMLFSYLQRRLDTIHRWSDGPLNCQSMKVHSMILHHHGVECRGLRFSHPCFVDWGILSDTAWFDQLGDFYRGCHTVIANVTLLQRRQEIDHLSLEDMPTFMESTGIKRLVMTHLGLQILDTGPEELARQLSTAQCQVLAARDDMTIDLPRK